METLIETPLTSMTLVFCFCYMSSVRSTSDGRGPVTRKRVPDREEPGKPRKDARRGRRHPLEAGFWPLWMTPLPRNCSHKSQVTGTFHNQSRDRRGCHCANVRTWMQIVIKHALGIACFNGVPTRASASHARLLRVRVSLLHVHS